MTDPNQPDKDAVKDAVKESVEELITVEYSPHSVEDTGEASGEKIDQLLATAVTVREELVESRQKVIVVFAIATVVLILVLGFAGGVLWGLRDQAATLEGVARDNQENGRIAKENSEILLNATGSEARARSAATLAGAINELERVGICAALYATDEFHPACQDVTDTMDRVLAGEDPFAR